jgi:uncharacterized protein (UPF0332 family)/predicted nucleotidyltransferase
MIAVDPKQLRSVNEFAFLVSQESKLKDYVKSIVLIGSLAREENPESVSKLLEKGDIDLLVIVDDTEENFPGEEEMKKLLEGLANSISPKLSLQVYTLTDFWDNIRKGHPVVYSFIKDGKVVIDSGFFKPVKRLLEEGRIPFTPEVINACVKEAENCLTRMDTVRLLMIAEDAYKCMVRMGEAVLMVLDEETPPPTQLHIALRRALPTNLIEQKYFEWLHEIVELRKRIERKEVLKIDGEQLDIWEKRCKEFYEKFTAILSYFQGKKILNIRDRTEEVFNKTMRVVLERINKLPKEASLDEVKKLFKEHFVDTGLIRSEYLELQSKLSKLKEELDRGELNEETVKQVYICREEVRSFIHAVGRALEKVKSTMQGAGQ